MGKGLRAGYGDYSDSDNSEDDAGTQSSMAAGPDAPETAVAFTFGAAEGSGWHAFTVYFTGASGRLFSLCPFLPARRYAERRAARVGGVRSCISHTYVGGRALAVWCRVRHCWG
jgi:hypothetical protein